MYSTIITIKDYPTLARALKQALPDYRKTKAIIIKANTVTPPSGYWEGGSRSTYDAFTLFGQHLGHVPAPAAPSQFGGADPVPYPIQAHVMVIQTGIFRGKTATTTIYLPDPAVFAIAWEK